MKHLLPRLLALLTLSLTASLSFANKPYETFGDYKVIYTVFNSSFIQPRRSRRLTCGKAQALVNIAVIKSTPDGDTKGLPVTLSGTVANLMQQQKILKFKEIHEQDAVYYLAPVRFTNEEVLNFAVKVKLSPNSKPFNVKFTKTLYVDR